MARIIGFFHTLVSNGSAHKPAFAATWRNTLLSSEQLIPALAFMTLGIAILYAIVNFFRTAKRQGERQQTHLTRTSEQTRAREGSIIKK